MTEWRLKDCCYSISDGDHLPPPKSSCGIPFITISNIDSTNHIDFENTLFVPIEYYNNLDSIRKPQVNDIIYSVVGSFGKPVLIKENRPFVFQRHIAILRPNNEIVDSRYLYYVMLSRDFYMQADSVALGAAQRTISLTSLRNMKVQLPDLAVQRRIAEVLSRYDALIENYQRQIKLLEEAAQRLYKEWFVDLRFPGHQSTPIINNLPQSWQKKKLIELVNVQYGYAFDGSLFNSDKKGMPIVRIRNIPDGYTSDYTTEEASPEYVVRNGDILVGMDGIFHINSWSGGNALLVQRACSFRPKAEELRGFVFQAIKEPIKYFEKTLVGSTVAHLGKKHIDSIELLVPSNKELFEPFTRFFNQRQGLLAQIRNLSEARDRLLPKLMSAEINV